MAMFSKRTPLVLAAAVTALAVGTGSASARSASPSCARFSPALIHAVLGVTVGHLTTSNSHGQLVCSYSVNGVPDAVKAIFASGVSTSAFAASKASASHSFPHITTVHGLGDAAWATKLGSGTYGSSLLYIHKGNSELDVTATASLAKVKALARMLLPLLG